MACAIVGMHAPEMIATKLELMRAFKPMTRAELAAWRTRRARASTVICRMCGASRPCPAGIDIPGGLRAGGVGSTGSLVTTEAKYAMDAGEIADLKGYSASARPRRRSTPRLSADGSECTRLQGSARSGARLRARRGGEAEAGAPEAEGVMMMEP